MVAGPCHARTFAVVEGVLLTVPMRAGAVWSRWTRYERNRWSIRSAKTLYSILFNCHLTSRSAPRLTHRVAGNKRVERASCSVVCAECAASGSCCCDSLLRRLYSILDKPHHLSSVNQGAPSRTERVGRAPGCNAEMHCERL